MATKELLERLERTGQEFRRAAEALACAQIKLNAELQDIKDAMERERRERFQ